MNDNSGFVCTICGYTGLKARPRSSSGVASHEICPCCHFQFGYHDDDQGLTYDEWRRRWVVEKRMAWASRRIHRPPNWNPIEQLRQLTRTQHVVASQEEFRQRYR